MSLKYSHGPTYVRFFVRPQVKTSLKQLGQSKPNFVSIDWVFVMVRGANVHVMHFDWGGGQMSNTFFESGGKCPPMLIIRGQMYSYAIFIGGKCPRGQMSYTHVYH